MGPKSMDSTCHLVDFWKPFGLNGVEDSIFVDTSIACQTAVEQQVRVCRARGWGLALWVHSITLLFSTITRMCGLFNIKRKKSPKPPPQSISPRNPAHIASGPSGSRTELAAVREGG